MVLALDSGTRSSNKFICCGNHFRYLDDCGFPGFIQRCLRVPLPGRTPHGQFHVAAHGFWKLMQLVH